MTVTKAIDKILAWPKALLAHVEFKCSFHYLELKKKGLLDKFAENVNNAWKAGASINIEITPTDELIPYIDECREFSLNNFGALPHLSIARDDRTSGIDYLTNLTQTEYQHIWSQFNSDFWKFKREIFGKKQKEFCYAGAWSLYIDLTSGEANCCYCNPSLGDVFKNPQKKLPALAIGKCPIAHCYNGHAYMAMGLIPHKYSVRYGELRDRVRTDGTHWLHPELRSFFNSRLEDSNHEFSMFEKIINTLKINCKKIITYSNFIIVRLIKKRNFINK